MDFQKSFELKSRVWIDIFQFRFFEFLFVEI